MPKHQPRLHHLVLPLAVLLAFPACAQERGDAPAVTLGGFGTIGAVHSEQRHADFTSSPLTPGQAGYTHAWSMDVDSRLGAQLTLNADKQWSAVVQVVSERTVRGNYRPHVEWANVKYQATPDLSVRLGRIALPAFLAADYRKASYALPWVRPPVELYSSLPVSNSDGVDTSYRWTAAGIRNETQLLYGRTSVAISQHSHAEARRVASISNVATRGDLSMRVTAMTAVIHTDLAMEFFDALRQFGSSGAALSAQYGLDEKRISAYSAGFSYDPGHWFLMGEAARVNARSMLGDRKAWYVSGGYRLGAFTPYLTYSSVGLNMDSSSAGIALNGLPPAFAAQAAMLNEELNRQLRMIGVQRSTSAGLRWDFASGYALKLQHDRVRPREGSQGTLINVQPGFQSGQTFGVYSAVVDFVF
jgi:hypothetical protein